jgi:hypothetical protein
MLPTPAAMTATAAAGQKPLLRIILSFPASLGGTELRTAPLRQPSLAL